MGKNLIAIVVLVILGVAALVVFRDRPHEEKQQAEKAVKKVPLERLNTIRIARLEGKGKEAVKEEYELKKNGDIWKLAKPVVYPVVESSIKRMTEALGDLNVIDTISENATKHELFEVDDKKGVTVTALRDQDVLAQLIVGKSQRNMTFVRLPGKDAVYRVQGSFKHAFNKSAKAMRDKTIIKLDQANIEKVAFKNGDNALVLANTGENGSQKLEPVDETIENFDETKANGIIQSLSTLTTMNFVDEPLTPDKTGLGDAAATVEIETKGSGETEKVTVWIGNHKETGGETYLKSSESKQVFLVSTATAKRFLVKADDFARTKEELAKEEERKKKAQAEAAKRGGMPGGFGPGNQQISPELMAKIRAQMAAQQLPQQ